MKVTIEQSKLVDVINWVSRSLSSRPIQTALLGIVLEADQNKIYLSSTDHETASRANTEAEVATPGKVLVPGKLLADIARSLPNKPVTIQLDGTRVLVNAGTAKFTLPILPINAAALRLPMGRFGFGGSQAGGTHGDRCYEPHETAQHDVTPR